MKRVVYLVVVLFLWDTPWVCHGSDIFESFFPEASHGSHGSASARGRATVATSSQARIEGPGSVSTQAKAVLSTASMSSHRSGTTTPAAEAKGKKRGKKGKKGKKLPKPPKGLKPEEAEMAVAEVTTTEVTETTVAAAAVACEEAPSSSTMVITSTTSRTGPRSGPGTDMTRPRTIDYASLRRRFFSDDDDSDPDQS